MTTTGVEKRSVGIFQQCGALKTGHFQYTSGRHGEVYVNKDAVIAHPNHLFTLCRYIRDRFRDDGIQVVAAPAIGGVALSQWTAFHLSEGRRSVLAVYAEKDGDDLVFKRGYADLISGKRILVVEDIVTTGGSLEKLIAAVQQHQGEVVGAGLLWNRGGVEFEVPTFSLVNKQFQSWAPEECELCKQGVPFDQDLGHAKDKKASV